MISTTLSFSGQNISKQNYSKISKERWHPKRWFVVLQIHTHIHIRDVKSTRSSSTAPVRNSQQMSLHHLYHTGSWYILCSPLKVFHLGFYYFLIICACDGCIVQALHLRLWKISLFCWEHHCDRSSQSVLPSVPLGTRSQPGWLHRSLMLI